MDSKANSLLEKLSPLERKILPYLNKSVEHIKREASIDEVSLRRALQFLENKGLLVMKSSKKAIIELGTNGIYYKKNYLPERKMLMLLEENNHIPIDEAKKISKLSENEFNISLGVLKNKGLIVLNKGKISLSAQKSEISKKFLEEHFLDILPIEKEKLSSEQIQVFEALKKRKEIVEVREQSTLSFELTELGKSLAGQHINLELIEEITPEVISSWSKSKKFRKYDLHSSVPKIHGGKKHFVNQAIEYAKKIWLEMGFEEMPGSITQSAFWNFDALFTAQDHSVRELQDTFYIKDTKGKLPEKRIINAVKEAHESGVAGSSGWGYKWNEDEAKKIILRTHTTALSAHMLSSIKNKTTGKFFAIGKCFRNETIDWSHGFEFNQTEGIVVSKEANFSHLLGYLREFYKKMGFNTIKFVPAYFPYTEPSIEIYAFHPERKIWIELGGAGIFRPEVTIPLLGEWIPVLAWGPGLDRMLMDYYKIKDLRELYENDISKLRNMKNWIK